MTAGVDNEIVWLIRITRDNTTWKFATKDITLSSNLWDGKALAINNNRYSIGEFGKTINVPYRSMIGDISSISFSFIRYGANTFINDFFNEFFPATSGVVLIATNVEVGIVWDGATSENDITWLYEYNIDTYQYDDVIINLNCTEGIDYQYSNIPYYKIQKEYDNGVSYFTNAPEENYTLSIPIVYGDYTLTANEGITRNIVSSLAKTLIIDQTTFKAIIASHECSSNADVYQYAYSLRVKHSVDSFDFQTTPGTPIQTSAKTTSYAGTTFTLLEDDLGTITGGLVIYPKLKGVFSDTGTFSFDKLLGLEPYRLNGGASYGNGERVAFRFEAYESSPMLGEFNSETQVQLNIDFNNTVNPAGALNNIQIITYDHQLESQIDTYNAILPTGNSSVQIDYSTIFTIQNWDWRKILNLEFTIKNLYGNVTDYIWVNKIYFYAYYYYARGNYGVGKRMMKFSRTFKPPWGR